jgi:hypothetical protein
LDVISKNINFLVSLPSFSAVSAGFVPSLFTLSLPCFSECETKVAGDSGVPRNFVRGRGGQQIQLRTEDRENGDLGAVAPYQVFWRQL